MRPEMDHLGAGVGLLVVVGDGDGVECAHRVVAFEQVAADEVGRGQVLVARHSDERRLDPRTRPRIASAIQPMRHVLEEPRLAATRGPLQQHRHARPVGGEEQIHLVADRKVVGRLWSRPRRRRLQGLSHGLPR